MLSLNRVMRRACNAMGLEPRSGSAFMSAVTAEPQDVKQRVSVEWNQLVKPLGIQLILKTPEQRPPESGFTLEVTAFAGAAHAVVNVLSGGLAQADPSAPKGPYEVSLGFSLTLGLYPPNSRSNPALWVTVSYNKGKEATRRENGNVVRIEVYNQRRNNPFAKVKAELSTGLCQESTTPRMTNAAFAGARDGRRLRLTYLQPGGFHVGVISEAVCISAGTRLDFEEGSLESHLAEFFTKEYYREGQPGFDASVEQEEVEAQKSEGARAREISTGPLAAAMNAACTFADEVRLNDPLPLTGEGVVDATGSDASNSMKSKKGKRK